MNLLSLLKLNETLDPNKPLDRHPGITSFLTAGAVLMTAYSTRPFFETAADKLWPSVEWASNHPLLVTALCLALVAIALNWLISRIKMAWRYNLGRGCVPLMIIMIIFVLFWNDMSKIPNLGFCAIGLWFLIYLMRFEKFQKQDQPIDSLNRGYFADRLAEKLKENSTINRIAVLGSWGEGKTRLLELIRWRLSKETSLGRHIMTVNPWTSRTAEEAWTCLAEAIDKALGVRPLFRAQWINHPLVGWILKFWPSSQLTPELIRFFSGQTSGNIDSINVKIDDSLNNKDARVLIFVDDMERTDPLILRALLPVINKLDGLTRCVFIFALDPDRIGEAFGDNGTNQWVAKGFLDKVFDLQIPLPEARVQDVALMIRSNAEDYKLSKFLEAFSTFKKFIPSNPRLALRFLEDAKTKEALFLDRHRSNERNLSGFFIFLIAQTEFPQFAMALMSVKEQIGNGSLILGKRKQDQKFEDKKSPIIQKIFSILGISESDLTADRVIQLITALIDCNTSASDIEWFSGGYSKLLELSASEREELTPIWNKSAGSQSIDEMINTCWPDRRFATPSRCLEQLLDEDIRITGDILNQNIKYIKINECTSRISRLRRHLEFAESTPQNDDIICFNEILLENCFSNIYIRALRNIPAGSTQSSELFSECLELHSGISRHLSPYRCYSWATREVHGITRRLDYSQTIDLTRLSTFRKNLYTQVTKSFEDFFRSPYKGLNIAPSGYPSSWDYTDLYKPESWLFMEDQDWKTTLTSLTVEANGNQHIAERCSEIAIGLFLYPISASKPETNGIKFLAEKYPDYIKFYWKAAMTLPIDNHKKQEILDYRSRSYEIHNDNEPLCDMLDEIFSVEDQ